MRPPGEEDLGGLPLHYRDEVTTLRAAGVKGWQQLAALNEQQLRALARSGRASEARLLQLRAQARLMEAAGLARQEAALLLHAGIAESTALAQADPQRLHVLVRRLWTRLLGPALPTPSLSTVQGWIRAAAASRSAN